MEELKGTAKFIISEADIDNYAPEIKDAYNALTKQEKKIFLEKLANAVLDKINESGLVFHFMQAAVTNMPRNAEAMMNESKALAQTLYGKPKKSNKKSNKKSKKPTEPKIIYTVKATEPNCCDEPETNTDSYESFEDAVEAVCDAVLESEFKDVEDEEERDYVREFFEDNKETGSLGIYTMDSSEVHEWEIVKQRVK